MPRAGRPEWLRRFAELPGVRRCAQWPRASRWAAKYETFAAAWEALEDTSWLIGVLCATADPDCEKYESADTIKAREFHDRDYEDDAAKCAAFRKAWPGVPRAVGRVLRGVK